MVAVWILLAIVVALLAAWVGRRVAAALRLPGVIGEICVGLALGPLTVAATGWHGGGTPLDGIRTGLTLIGQAAVILYLMNLAHDVRRSLNSRKIAETARVTLVSVLVSLAAGVALAAIVILDGEPELRGTATSATFILYSAIAMGVTAAPVLARIINERGMTGSSAARISFAAAVLSDAIAWLLLAVALGLNSGRPAGVIVAAAAAAGGVLLAWGARGAARRLSAWSARRPGLAATLAGTAALAAGFASESLGLTVIFGACLAGLALPRRGTSQWDAAVATTARCAKPFLPLFFVATGLTVFANGVGAVPWGIAFATVALGVLGKFGGGYLGGRLGAQPPLDSARIGAMLNTRGLTELIILQAGHQTGILATRLFLAFLVMALATTAVTGPLLALLDRVEARRNRVTAESFG
ncbi:cation:proton antiporter [Amycolatopsis sp. NPDC059090]|uniref:cation:proton antiporter n=1 Tax=Amycolatopsis sp. NPDC059090 TaxID=3346723 RepID=UPI00366BFDB3